MNIGLSAYSVQTEVIQCIRPVVHPVMSSFLAPALRTILVEWKGSLVAKITITFNLDEINMTSGSERERALIHFFIFTYLKDKKWKK